MRFPAPPDEKRAEPASILVGQPLMDTGLQPDVVPHFFARDAHAMAAKREQDAQSSVMQIFECVFIMKSILRRRRDPVDNYAPNLKKALVFALLG